METGPQLKVSSDQLVKLGIEPATLGYKASSLSTTPQQLLQSCVKLKDFSRTMQLSYSFQGIKVDDFNFKIQFHKS